MDDWYESEESTRLGMIVEVQRIQRRMRTRPVPVLVLAAVATLVIVYWLATRKSITEAQVVLAMTEGSLSQHQNGIPADELHQYVADELIPDSKLLELIAKHDLFPSRARFGERYALDALRGMFHIEVWKNSFGAYNAGELKSARIGITVADVDGDRAFDLARDLATIVIDTAQEQRLQLMKDLVGQLADIRDRLTTRLDDLTRRSSQMEIDQAVAHRDGREVVAQALTLQLDMMWREQMQAERTLTELARSRDNIADDISEAGLDINLQVVEERRPEVSEHRGFVIALAAVVVAIASLLGSALIVGAFDPRVHDSDDVERLGISVLGHLPGFSGDHVGSLQARGVRQRRVPLSERLRWLSRR